MNHLNYFYDGDEFCLQMSPKFVEYVDALNKAISIINEKSNIKLDITDYETLQQINPTYISTFVNNDNEFIEWWDLCVKYKLIKYLEKVVTVDEGTFMKGIQFFHNKNKQFNIIIPDDFSNDFWYCKFLRFDNICNTCWFGINRWCHTHNNNSYYCRPIFKEIFFTNLVNTHYEIKHAKNDVYKTIAEQFKIIQELCDELKQTSQKIGNDKTIVQQCMIPELRDKLNKQRKEFEEYKTNAEQYKMMIQELREELNKQRKEFEEYKNSHTFNPNAGGFGSTTTCNTSNGFSATTCSTGGFGKTTICTTCGGLGKVVQK